MSSAFRRNFCKTRYNSPRLARVARIHNFMAGSNAFLHPATRRPPLSSSSRTCTAASLLLSVGRMNTAPTQLTLDITALSHDGRGIARLAPADDHASKGTVVFVANALPGQRVNASVLRRKTSFIDAEASTLLSQSPDAVDPICPHHAECGGCPLQTMPYAQQLYWKRTLAVDALTRIGKFDRAQIESMLPPVTGSPALTRFRNKMEFAFGHDTEDGTGLKLGLRRRNGRDVVDVPHCALMPSEALQIVSMVGKLAAQSGLAAYAAPDARQGQPFRPTQGQQRQGHRGGFARRTPRSHAIPIHEAVDYGFWRFFVLRRGLAADMRTPRWWALCITSPGDTAQRAVVRMLGREVLAAFPQLAAFIHEERATADAFAFGEKRVQTLDDTGRENPSAARLFLPLAGMNFTLDAASFFQVNTGGAQTLAHAAQRILLADSPAASPQDARPRGLLDLYCGVGAPGLLLARNYSALLGLEQDSRAVKLAAINARANDINYCQYEAGDAAYRLEHLAPLEPASRWLAAGFDESASIPQATDALADPPRAGLSPRALDALMQIAPDRILYISCNPATLARDAAQLRNRYSLERLEAVDLFPHTPHLECLSLWRRLD